MDSLKHSTRTLRPPSSLILLFLLALAMAAATIIGGRPGADRDHTGAVDRPLIDRPAHAMHAADAVPAAHTERYRAGGFE